jgi:hypothetical protein
MRVASLALLAIVGLSACATNDSKQASNDEEERVYVTGSMIPRKKSDLPTEVKSVSGESMDRSIGASAGIGGAGPSGK